jgi:hypothetical protein
MDKSVEGGSAEDVQGRDYWGIVEPGCRRNRGLALGHRQGSAAPMQRWIKAF